MIASNPRSSNNNNRPPSSAEGSSSPAAAAARLTPPRGGAGGAADNNDDTSDVARAQAEVSVLPPTGPSTGVGGEAGARSTGPRGRPPGQEAANAAIQGTAAGEGGEAAAFEVVDEGGELVKVRFHEFLNN